MGAFMPALIFSQQAAAIASAVDLLHEPASFCWLQLCQVCPGAIGDRIGQRIAVQVLPESSERTLQDASECTASIQLALVVGAQAFNKCKVRLNAAYDLPQVNF